MLAAERQTVHVPAPNEPGYDIVLTLPSGKRLRVSCKALGSSAYDAALKADARRAFEVLRQQLPSGCAQHLVLEAITAKAPLPPAEQLLSLARGCSVVTTSACLWMRDGSWRIAVVPLGRLNNAEFSDEKVSVGLSVFVPLHVDEQKRFDDKIDDACTNLARHFSSATADEGSVIAMSVPEEVSMQQARAYALSSRLGRHPSVAAALLFRTQVCSNGKDISLGHEFEVVQNPAAQFALAHYAPSGSLTVQMLLGNVLGAVPVETPTLPPYVAPNPEATHVFERQHHHYVRHYKGKHVQGEQPPNLLGLSCEWTFLGVKRVDVRFTSTVADRDLVLL
ncbi:MAG TPA: hypothetical protein VFQ61_07710 [Polyangiaceae bacterium]|nr:hypothetical protein [Polyangiaceae bacterium]